MCSDLFACWSVSLFKVNNHLHKLQPFLLQLVSEEELVSSLWSAPTTMLRITVPTPSRTQALTGGSKSMTVVLGVDVM